MHRSGTSLVARLTNLLGVNLGQEPDIIQAAPDNPRGFWEHPRFRLVNDELLARLGLSWDTVEAPPESWQDDRSLDDLRDLARGAIEMFAGDALWGWKDPRTCLTLPFWQPLAPPMRYVICLRSVLDVARSLERRNGMPIGKGGRLWLQYTAAALERTASAPRMCVFFEDVIANPLAQAARLSQFITGDAQRAESSTDQIREAVDAELHHHRSSLADVAREAALPDAAKLLYMMLRTSVPEVLASAGTGFDEIVAALREAASQPTPATVISDLQAVKHRLDGALADRTRELEERRRELDDRNREVAERARELAERIRELEERDRLIEKRVQEIAELSGRCDDYEERLAALTAELEALSGAHQTSLAANEELAAQLQAIFNSRAWHWLTEYRRMRKWIDRRHRRGPRASDRSTRSTDRT
jgi:hypothetical protein